MPLQRWTFYDPISDETWVLARNPSDGGTPSRKKKLSGEDSTAPDGQVILFEGPDEVRVKEWKGTILDEAEYRAWEHWWSKRHQVRLVDDLNVEWWIYITDFEPERVRSAIYPWKHTYTVRAHVLSGGG